MPSLEALAEIAFDLSCSECGSGLTCSVSGTDVEVDVCESCLTSAEERGYESGWSEGNNVGEVEGYERGLEEASPVLTRRDNLSVREDT